MSLGLKKNPRFNQGYYKPIQAEKYIGKDAPIYRSGIELLFMRWCDNNDNVLKWSSEPFPIPYFDSIQKKWRKYYIDFILSIKEGENVKNYLIEIKPYKQTLEPVNKKNKKKANLLYEQMMFQNNQDKFKFAKAFAEKNDMEFLIITDNDLK